MKIKFDKKAKLILINVSIKGPTKIVEAIFALNTGATTSVVNFDILEKAGYKKRDFIDQTRITTGSRTESASLFKIKSIQALDLIRRNYKIISHDLPITTFVDGLLGLNFFRYKELNINFNKGELELK